MKKLTVALALATTLAACTPETQPTAPGTTPPPVVSTSPSPSPTPSPQPSPSFTHELSTEQQGALDAVVEYFRLLDLVQVDPTQDLQQLTDLYSNTELALQERQLLNAMRAQGIRLVGWYVYHWRSVDEPLEADGKTTIQVHVCIDTTNADIVDPDGNSVISSTTGYMDSTYVMEKAPNGWVILAVSEQGAVRC